MLSEHDRAVLKGMERELRAEVPELAASFDAWQGRRSRGLRMAIGLAVAVLLTGLVLASVVLFWLGALAVGALLGLHHWRHARRRTT